MSVFSGVSMENECEEARIQFNRCVRELKAMVKLIPIYRRLWEESPRKYDEIKYYRPAPAERCRMSPRLADMFFLGE